MGTGGQGEFGEERAWQMVAEHEIQAAIDAGEFADLPELGRPCRLIDEPHDPHGRIRRKMAWEGLLSRRPGAE